MGWTIIRVDSAKNNLSKSNDSTMILHTVNFFHVVAQAFGGNDYGTTENKTSSLSTSMIKTNYPEEETEVYLKQKDGTFRLADAPNSVRWLSIVLSYVAVLLFLFAAVVVASAKKFAIVIAITMALCQENCSNLLLFEQVLPIRKNRYFADCKQVLLLFISVYVSFIMHFLWSVCWFNVHLCSGITGGSCNHSHLPFQVFHVFSCFFSFRILKAWTSWKQNLKWNWKIVHRLAQQIAQLKAILD